MTSEPAGHTQEQQKRPTQQGWFKIFLPVWLKKLLLLPINWWPITITVIPVTVIASYPYAVAVLEIQDGHILSNRWGPSHPS